MRGIQRIVWVFNEGGRYLTLSLFRTADGALVLRIWIYGSELWVGIYGFLISVCATYIILHLALWASKGFEVAR